MRIMTKKQLKRKYDDLYYHAETLERYLQEQNERLELIHKRIDELIANSDNALNNMKLMRGDHT